MSEISIIIPVYNVEKYLRKCLDSVLAQTFPNFEVICVNDGSTDTSLQILQEYASKDKRIIIIDGPNQGAGAARNIGIERSKGNYLWLIDGDDFVQNNALDVICNYTQQTPSADVILFDAYYIALNGDVYESNVFKPKFLPKENPFSPTKYNNFLFQLTTPTTWTKVFKRSFVIENAIEFQNISSCNDLFFTRMALVSAHKIGYINEKLYNYRVEAYGSISSKKLSGSQNIITASSYLKKGLIDLGNFDLYKKTFYKAVVENIKYQFDGSTNELIHKMLKEIKDLLPIKYRIKLKRKLFNKKSWLFCKIKDKTGRRIYYLFGIKIFSYSKVKKCKI